MGGKIRAYNKITKYAEELAQQQHQGGMQEVIMSTDQAYWQVISLVNKKKLAEGYLKLLQQLDSDVEKMIAEGVATKADGLSVRHVGRRKYGGHSTAHTRDPLRHVHRLRQPSGDTQS